MLIYTERLILRNFEASDFESFALLAANPEVMRFSLKGSLSTEQSKEYFEKRILSHYRKYGFGLLATFLKDTQEFIGFVGLISQNIDETEEIELAYRLLPKYWSQGFTTEAANAVCAYAFQTLKAERLISLIDSKNHSSLRFANRVGMHFWKHSMFHGIPVQVYCLTKITIMPYQASWVEYFRLEKEKLEKVFNGLEIEFHHIGSTSIPLCSAKPIIDILGITPDISRIDTYNETMSKLGYTPKGEYGMRQRRYFHKRPIDAVNLHIFEDTNPEVERHLRFCAYLREHPERVREYSKLKSDLATHFPHDIHQYILGKERWIKNVDRLAAENFTKPFHVKKKGLRRRFTSLTDILQAMEANMHLHMTYFAKYLPTLELVFEPDVTVIRSEIPDDMFNYVLFAKFQEKNVHDRVAHITSLYRKYHLPFSWWVSEKDTPPNLTTALMKEGLVFKEENVGMYFECDAFQAQTHIPSLKFKRVLNSKELQEFCQIIVEIGGDPQAFDLIYSQLPQVLYAEGSSFEMHIGYIGELSVLTGILVFDANVAGIYYVATIPSQRKKGYGMAMMEHLLNRAKMEGYHMATIQASHEGKGLYEKLGFKKCCIFKEYAERLP